MNSQKYSAKQIETRFQIPGVLKDSKQMQDKHFNGIITGKKHAYSE